MRKKFSLRFMKKRAAQYRHLRKPRFGWLGWSHKRARAAGYSRFKKGIGWF
jgi:hypothetical protein